MRRTPSGFSAFVLVASICFTAACSEPYHVANTAGGGEGTRLVRLKRARDSVVPFFRPMRVERGDWLAKFPENGETFEQFVEANPQVSPAPRRRIYIKPLGTFNTAQSKLLNVVAEYVSAFFGLQVTLLITEPLSAVPRGKTRTQYPKNVQIRTDYFLNDLGSNALPSDAAALIYLTDKDLFTSPTSSFVFGEALLGKRVAVSSLYRLGKITGKSEAEELLLQRSLKMVMHETGHALSMRHCTEYECLMSGTNSLTEADRRPVDVCPDCMAKIAWAFEYDPASRYQELSRLWQKYGHLDESSTFEQKGSAVRAAT